MIQLIDSIARLVLDDYKLAVSQAKSERDAAQANWQLLETGTRKEDLEAASADYEAARSSARFWVSEMARVEKLYKSKTITDSERDRVRQQRDATLQQRRAAKARLDRAVAGPRSEAIAAAAAQVQARGQALALAERQLHKATLRAPFAGRIERRFLDAGAYVNVFPSGGVPVVHLVDLSQVDVLVAVPENMLQHFSLGQPIEVASAVDPQLRVGADIIALGHVADPDSGTYQLRARIANQDARFTAGMVVTATAITRSSRPVIRVPVDVLCRAYGQPAYVYLVGPDGDRVVSREIKIGPITGDFVEVERGLSGGELLIVGGGHGVVSGDRVQSHLIEPRSATPTGQPLP